MRGSYLKRSTIVLGLYLLLAGYAAAPGPLGAQAITSTPTSTATSTPTGTFTITGGTDTMTATYTPSMTNTNTATMTPYLYTNSYGTPTVTYAITPTALAGSAGPGLYNWCVYPSPSNVYEIAHTSNAYPCMVKNTFDGVGYNSQINIFGNLTSTANGASDYSGADWHLYVFNFIDFGGTQLIQLSGFGSNNYNMMINPTCAITYPGSPGGAYANFGFSGSVTVAVVGYSGTPGPYVLSVGNFARCNTPTFPPTPSSTQTWTSTPTNTNSPINTSTPTFTLTNTPTFTGTWNTNTPTPDPTPFTPTFTITGGTNTMTATYSPTYTLTGSPTPLPSNTNTWTPEISTSTYTPTPTYTGTFTFTDTPTTLPTSTWTPSPTGTVFTPTSTWTMTFTGTSTATYTLSPTPTSTPVPLGTPIAVTSQVVNPSTLSTLSLGNGTVISIPPNSFTQAVTVTLTEYPVADAPATATAFQVNFMSYVYLIDAGGLEPQAGSSVTITLPYDPAQIPSGYSSSDLTVSYYNGSSWVVLTTSLNTIDDTLTVVTDHFSWWASVLYRHSPTPSPTIQAPSSPLLYPNPATGDQVKLHLPVFAAPGNVKVRIYSLSFRKLQDVTFPNVGPGTSITLDLLDKAGVRLADGLYYVLVTPPDGVKTTLKLLVQR